MKFIDFFSGIGGFRRAFEEEGHECIAYAEIDKSTQASYEGIFNINNQAIPLGDVKKIGNINEISKADIWCVGFPCQDISQGGKGKKHSDWKGLEGENSCLIFHVIDILHKINEKNLSLPNSEKLQVPKYIVLENSSLLLESKKKTKVELGNKLNDVVRQKGWDFAILLMLFNHFGYDVEWQVINSSDYIPQNRERIYIVCQLREIDKGFKPILPIEVSGKVSMSKFKIKKNDNPYEPTIKYQNELFISNDKVVNIERNPKVNIGFSNSHFGDIDIGKYIKILSMSKSQVNLLNIISDFYSLDTAGIQCEISWPTYGILKSGEFITRSLNKINYNARELNTCLREVLVTDRYIATPWKLINVLYKIYKDKDSQSIRVYETDKCFKALTASDDIEERQIVITKGPLIFRYITPLESFILQGFEESDFSNARKALINELKDSSDGKLEKSILNLIDELGKEISKINCFSTSTSDESKEIFLESIKEHNELFIKFDNLLCAISRLKEIEKNKSDYVIPKMSNYIFKDGNRIDAFIKLLSKEVNNYKDVCNSSNLFDKRYYRSIIDIRKSVLDKGDLNKDDILKELKNAAKKDLDLETKYKKFLEEYMNVLGYTDYKTSSLNVLGNTDNGNFSLNVLIGKLMNNNELNIILLELNELVENEIDKKLLKQTGNSVTVDVIKDISKSITKNL